MGGEEVREGAMRVEYIQNTSWEILEECIKILFLKSISV